VIAAYDYSNLRTLKDFYRAARKLTQRYSPQATFVFHDAGFYNAQVWNSLFRSNDWDKVVMDHHYYQVRSIEGNSSSGYTSGYINEAKTADGFHFPVWFGEWAISTDICAQWLEGFNDGYTDLAFHGRFCYSAQCPISYMPEPFKFDFNRTEWNPGPYGTSYFNQANIFRGTCLNDSYMFGESGMKNLAATALSNFRAHLGGSFFMNLLTEQRTPRFDYLVAWEKGWLNQ